MINDWISRFDGLLRWCLRLGVVALLIGVPVYPKFPLISVPGTYVSIRAEDFLIAVVSIIWLLTIRARIKMLWEDAFLRAISFFILVGILSAINAWFVVQTVDPLQLILHTARRIEYILPCLFVITSITSREDIYFYLKVIVLALLMVFVYGVGQKMFEFPIISTMNKEYSQGVAQAIMPGARINSTFAGHYDLAAYGVMMMSLLLGMTKAFKNWSSRVVLIVCLGATLFLLVVSASRISYAAYLGSMVITMVLLRKWWWIAPMIAISIVASNFAPNLASRYADSLKYEILPRLAALEWHWGQQAPGGIALAPTPTAKPTPTKIPANVGAQPGVPVNSTGTTEVISPTPTPVSRSIAGTPVEYVELPEDRSTAIRFKVEWPRALRAVYKSPLLGTGYSSLTLATDNDYLRALGETGLLGLGAFLLIFGVLFNRMKMYVFRKDLAELRALIIGFGGSFIGLLANALFIDVFEASKIAILFWLFVGIVYQLMKVADGELG